MILFQDAKGIYIAYKNYKKNRGSKYKDKKIMLSINYILNFTSN